MQYEKINKKIVNPNNRIPFIQFKYLKKEYLMSLDLVFIVIQFKNKSIHVVHFKESNS